MKALFIFLLIVSVSEFSFSQPILSLIASDPACHGESNGSITVIAQGGIPPYTISWQHDSSLVTFTANSLPGGTYTATITDSNGDVSTVTHILNDPPAITATFNVTHINCFEDSTGSIEVTDVLNLQPQGNQNPSTNIANVDFFAWDLPNMSLPPFTTSAVSDLPAGNYGLIIGDNYGCTNSFDFTLIENTEITLTTSANHLTASNNGSVSCVATGGSGTFTYSWTNLNDMTTSTSALWSNLGPGIYVVEVMDGNGCTKTDTITLAWLSNEELVNNEVTVYPTLVEDGYVYISNVSHGDFLLYNATGQLVLSQTFNGNNKNLELKLPNGVYHYVVNSKTNAPIMGKIVISK